MNIISKLKALLPGNRRPPVWVCACDEMAGECEEQWCDACNCGDRHAAGCVTYQEYEAAKPEQHHPQR